MKTDYRVTLSVLTTHEYAIEANTSDEAESVAEQWHDEGEEGTVTSTEIIDRDCYPVEVGEE